MGLSSARTQPVCQPPPTTGILHIRLKRGLLTISTQFQLSISQKKQFKGSMVKGVLCFVLAVSFAALATAAPQQALGTADCVFPFVYKDFTYNQPTTARTDPPRWWCAISIKPGEQHKVDNWVYTNDSTSSRGSRQCQFPFEYKNVTYAGCTDVNHSSCWCSFSRKYVSGGWGKCNHC